LNGLYRIQIHPFVGTWTDLTTCDSPALSQHQCINWKNQLIVFIGGWTGRTRIPGLHFFNPESGRWLPPALKEPELRGYPSGAGLSAHTVIPFESDAKSNSLSSLIFGREGSTRIQRRRGNAYLLQGSFRSSSISGLGDVGPAGFKPRFIYTEAPGALHIESRSYHTSTPTSHSRVITIGGRSNSTLEVVDLGGMSHLPPLEFNRATCDEVTYLLDVNARQPFEAVPVERLKLSGWRGHYAIPGGRGFLVGGGDGFSALRPDPLDMAYIHAPANNNNNLLSYAGRLRDRRAYAVCSINPTDSTAWLQGGLGPGMQTLASLMRLQVAKDSEGAATGP
uniref:Galactose oxidase n=1 Tax=Schistocephalus solidus TaxID=70667 RepID=A0A183SQ36_SCHSO